MHIGIGGSAANPPHIGHKTLLECLVRSGRFQRIIWLPSGIREDKVDFVASEHRVSMTKMTFAAIDRMSSQTKVEILFDDVYGENHPTIWWLEKIQRENSNDEVVWYTGADSVTPEKKYNGKCEIEETWVQGRDLMENWKFLIISRKGFPNPKMLKLPKQFEIFDNDLSDIRSSDIRKRIANGLPFEHLVVPDVAQYIKENHLYGYKDLN
ncbi:MAG: nicotinate-nicotinamide nucleotide adenylyltransferase [Candidatus Moraniibacteriota bacterium]